MRRLLAMVIALGTGAVACGSDSSDPPADQARPAAEADAVVMGTSAAPLPPVHPVFSLADNRLLAHRLHGGAPLIDAGSVSFARFVRYHHWRGGVRKLWTFAAEVDGVAVARMGRDAELTLPLTAEQAAATSIHLRLHSAEERRIHIGVNHEIKDKQGVYVSKVARGWQTVEIAIDPGMLKRGVNRIKLRRSHGSSLELAWIQIGGEVPSGLPPIHDAADDQLVIGDGDALVYYVQVPDDGMLGAAVVGDGCAVEVSAAPDGGDAVTGQLTSANSRVDLAALAGRAVRLELRASGCAQARLADAALLVPGAAPPAPPSAPPPKYVVLWVMDTMRADKMRTVNPDARAEIPNLMKLADNGAVFRQYYVQGNESQTSHSSVWTSLYPVNHKVITSGPLTNYILSKKHAAIGPIMKEAGFRTVGVTANGTIFGWSGYTRGFDVFNNLMKDGTGRKLGFRVPGDIVYDRVIDKLGEDVADPFFLFVGTIDTHKPWYGHEPWLSRYDPGPYTGRFKKNVLSAALGIPKGTHLCKWPVPPREMQRIHAIIDSAISFQDLQVGRLLEQLEAWGIADETMLIITADHGEELWEYKWRCGHGSSLRQTLVHVPLLIYYPPLIGKSVIDVGADGVDILPTILDALDRKPLEPAQGQSLIPLTHGAGAGYVRPSYASMNEWSHTMRLGKWKATVHQSGHLSLHDTEEDPYERQDFADDHPYARQLVNDPLALFLSHRARWKKRHWGVASNMTARGAAELEGSAEDGDSSAD